MLMTITQSIAIEPNRDQLTIVPAFLDRCRG